MTGIDRRNFALLMSKLRLGTGKGPSGVPEQAGFPCELDVWFDALADLPIGALRTAIEIFIRDGDDWPTPAKLRRLAVEARDGEARSHADVWPRVLKALRHFGQYRAAAARDAIPATVWQAIGAEAGWQHLCDMREDQRSTFAAQFRERYRDLDQREQRHRRLPASLRPRLAPYAIDEPQRLTIRLHDEGRESA